MSCQKRKAKKNAYQPKLSTFIQGKHSKPPDRSYCECPVCGLSGLPRNMINIHVDICLNKAGNESEMRGDFSAKRLKLEAETTTNAAEPSDINVHQKYVKSDGPLPALEVHGDISGLLLIRDFISAEEELFLLNAIETDKRTPWRESSFNGDCLSKGFGVITQFGLPHEERCIRKNNPALGEHDIPEYLVPFPLRLKSLVTALDNVPIELKSFTPNECNCNCYIKARNHYLKPHYDDRALSGPLLMNLSMGCAAYMTYISPRGEETAVLLPPRCLQIVIGPARWTYRHSIKGSDILGEKRISVTWRQSASRHKGMRGQQQPCSGSSCSSTGGSTLRVNGLTADVPSGS